MEKRKVLEYAHLIGEGIGHDFAEALRILEKGIATIDFKPFLIENFRLKSSNELPGELDPAIANVFKTIGVGMKGPTRTLEGIGPRSANAALRELLGLYANVRPVKWFKGVATPVKRPQDIDVVVFRQNTEDLYMGIEAKAGSTNALEAISFLETTWRESPTMFLKPEEVGVGIKLVSKSGSEKIMEAALAYAFAHGRKKVCIMHKANIMKFTEGAFKHWCIDYALAKHRDQVYLKGEESTFTPDEKKSRVYIDTVIADDAFAQLLQNPKRFDVIVTMNLNGDYVSDAAAAQVGGVPTAAGGNIGDDCAIFEAIGGTADDIAGKDIANPTAFLLAFAMMLEYKKFDIEASAIRTAIADLYANQIGTADMKFESDLTGTAFEAKVPTVLSTTKFAEAVAERVHAILSNAPTPVVEEVA